MQRLKFVGLLAVVVVGCAGEEPEGGAEDDLTSDSLPATFEYVKADKSNLPGTALKKASDAIGRISVYGGGAGGGYCTGFHLGGGRVITAGHCFTSSQPFDGAGICSGTFVEWGYRNNVAVMKSKCTKFRRVFFANETGKENDYAVFDVSPIPAEKLTKLTQWKDSYGTKLIVLGNPGGRNQSVAGKCRIVQQLPSPKMFQHNCDSESGYSGGPLILDSADPNKPGLYLVGIHSGFLGMGTDKKKGTWLSSVPAAYLP